jgi:hypothetical protein
MLCPLASVGQTNQTNQTNLTKFIRLRNETIATLHTNKTVPSATAALQNASAAMAAAGSNGLFLIQFEDHPRAAWRAQLLARGVDLVKYVPDDAYIARFKDAAVSTVAGLDYVRWVGAYRPEHKIHPRLAAAEAAREAGGQISSANPPKVVNILLSPRTMSEEIGQARAMLLAVEHESYLRQGVIVRGTLRPGFLNALARLDWVLWIEGAVKHKLNDELASKIVGGDDGLTGTPTVTEQLGFGGQGVTVCVSDTGLDTGNTNTMHPDVRGRVTGFTFYAPTTDGSDGYGHGTHCAGIVAGNAATGETDPATGAWYGLGVASGASLFVERIFDANANEVNPWPGDEKLTQDAVRAGAQIFSGSWGSDVQGEYDTDAAQFDELVRNADAASPGAQAFILEFSAGNAGPDAETMDSPASGKNVIATGASETVSGTYSQTYGLYDDGPDTMADFSSRGPCQDGRIKPDVVAPGTWIASMATHASTNEAAIAWTVIDSNYVYMGGTSMSGPFASGAAAVFVQYYRSTHTNATPSPALVKAALINSARELDESNGGPGPIPNNDEGWGRITLTNLIGTALLYQYVDQTVLLTTGQVYEQHTFVQAAGQPLKITLTYTDVPGFPGALPALVNDLDLEVAGPDGTLYRGNQFVNGESIPNAPTPDNLNNVEGVQLSNPAPGDYLVRVRARSVVEDARLDTAAIDQDFALVISGSLLGARQGAVLLDRADYTAPGTINLEVLDAGRAASNTVNVLLTSTSEPAGQNIVLPAAGGYGAFTGAVMTVTGSAAPAGELLLHNGDTITARYTDSAGVNHSATATADLIPPVISGVGQSIDLGVITITWQTSEPASSTVFYGTNRLALNQVASDPTLTTTHSVILRNLVAGLTYYFAIASADAAGNSVTNNNSGAFYSLVAVATPTVLLVDAYQTADGSPMIDDGTYTNALAAAGYSFAHWKVLERGGPLLSDLQPYRVVMWRTTDDIINYGTTPDGLPDPTATNNTLSVSQQAMIQTYLNGGGSFFMASMGILSQLGDVPFRQNVLQVGGFQQNPDPPSPCTDCDEDFGVPAILGAAGDPITSGMSITLDYSDYPSIDLGDGLDFGPDFSDTFTPTTNATAITFESVSGKPCGMRFPRTGVDNPGRVVFFSFPLDAVPQTGPVPDNEVVLLRNALNFLAPGANGISSVTLDSPTYTVPDQVTVQLGDATLAGTGQAVVTFSASSATNRVAVTAHEMSHPGLFRGFLTLVATNTTVPGQLRARNGDTISASYFEAAVQSNIVATATVDATPPVITNVTALTNIGGAVVSWTTSKPADSLVQYGESVLLLHTAYDPGLVTNHSITLQNLDAHRLYYYEVESRDQAGNSVTDDNHGAFYTFTTPSLLQPPWFDNLENGAKGWTAVLDPTFQSYGADALNWTLGTPNNGMQTNAYSGSHSWGSDLQGASFTLVGSLLYSPLIDLSGLSQATLTFEDCFDFSQEIMTGYYYEDGWVYISTNTSTPIDSLILLQDFSGMASHDWELETIDLTPFVGKTIQVVWEYQGAGGGTSYGWLVDDVGITGVGADAGGTIVINKNIGGGSFNLTGPISQSGTSTSTILSNVPPGQYIVRCTDIPFYITPPPQTNTLVGGGTNVFTLNYTFPDANHNGISDLFEQYYFGAVSANRTQLTDTDGDGMTDYAEFIAGTDPTNPASNLRFLNTFVNGGGVELQWSAVPGHLYQIMSSSNLVTWTPVTDWAQAFSSPMSYTATNAGARATLFRVQVRP